MVFPPRISDYYRNTLEQLRRKVQETGDADALGRAPDDWAAYLVDKHSMEPVEVDPDNPMAMKETTINGYPAVKVVQPMLWTGTLTVIAGNGLARQGAWSGFDYTTFFDSRFPGTIGLTVPLDAGNVGNAKSQIGQYIQALNSAIALTASEFPRPAE